MLSALKEKITALEVILKTVHAKDLMTASVITEKSESDLSEAANRMITNRIGGVPVTGKNGKMVGIITTTDLLIVMGMILDGSIEENGTATLKPTVSFAMTSDIVSVTKDTTLNEIVKIMRDKGIHTIPVMEGDKLVGVVGRHDVLRKFYEIVKNL